ncbi:MAG: ribbon-helix-helix protein, CopG family [Firmicutes bacterium]|nr:ribbon-helix-helix protein, CopG family [Bacillota bacterium]
MVTSNLKKATFALPEPLLKKLKLLANNNRIPSVNSAVREAIEDYIFKLEREEFRKAMEKAAKDPDFIRDIKDIERGFEYLDVETAEMIPKW